MSADQKGPYRTPETPLKMCCDPFGKGCVKPATVALKLRGLLGFRKTRYLCDRCLSNFMSDAGLMG